MHCLILLLPSAHTPSRYPDDRNISTLTALLHHGGVLFLEPLVQAGGTLQLLVDTAQDTLLFTVDEGLGGEIVDTVIEAALNHLGVHLLNG